MLRCEGLDIALDGFRLRADWTVRTGARVGVIGPSGAGKSTLLGALGGFVPLAAGRIWLDGRDITQAHPADRGMAMLFQDGNLLPGLNVFDNLALGLRPALRLSAEERARVEAALDKVGLSGLGARRPAQLSGGQQSRAALARALLQRKPVLLLDEPFAALGPALRGEMLDLVARVLDETGATLLMVTHDPKDALRIAGEVIFVEGGVAHAPAPTGPLLDDPPAALKAYLG